MDPAGPYLSEMPNHLIHSLSDAFMDIGVYLAIVLAVVVWASRRWTPRWKSAFAGRQHAGPLLAALLSVPPGCAGVIAVVSMYSRNSASYGTLITALVSTMGDAAWILIAAQPVLALQLKLIFVAIGIVVGYAVEFSRLEPRKPEERAFGLQLTVVRRPAVLLHAAEHSNGAGPAASVTSGLPSSDPTGITEPAGTTPPRQRELYLTDPRGYLLNHVFWSLISIGLVLRIPIDLGLVDEDFYEYYFGVNPYQSVGVLGIFVAAALALHRRKSRRTSVSQELRFHPFLFEASRQATSIICSVAVAYFALEFLIELTGLQLEGLPFEGLQGVFLAAAIGLMPSCGLEAVAAALFISGGMPLPALIAFLLSHAGAGMLPLLAIHRKSAIFSVFILVPVSIFVGSVALLL